MSACLPARLRLLPIAPWRRQAGFTLLEISFVLVVAGGLSIGALEMLRFQQMVEQGRHAGERLAVLREGAAAYTRDHGREILAQVPDHQRCAEVDLSSASAVATPAGGASALAGCGMKIDGQSVANVYQPTIAELQALGYVRLTDDLPFIHGDTIVDGHTGTQAVPRWRVSTRCSRHCAPPTGTVADAPKPVFSLMLFNSQPFFPQGKLQYGQAAQLKAAIQAIGPDALIAPPGSSPKVSRKLRSAAGQPATNPLRDAEDGVPGVLATLTYVDTNASRAAAPPTSCGGTSGVTCQDGSAPPTASWDFNGQALNNVGRLAVIGPANIAGELTAAQRVQANGGLTVRHPSGGLETRTAFDGTKRSRTYPIVDIHGHAVVRKRLVVGADVDNYFLDNAQDGMHVSGVLMVGRDSYIDASTTQRGGEGFNSRLSGIRIPTRNPGDPCNAQGNNPLEAGGNIALHQAFNSPEVYVMACSAKGQWVKASGG